MVLASKTRMGALLFALALIAAGCGGGGPDITGARLDETVAGMHTMVEETAAGRVEEGEEAFWEVHPFFHDIDPLLRDRDWPLAVSMWTTMMKIEIEYAGDPNPDVLVEEGRIILELLPKVSDVLDLEASA